VALEARRTPSYIVNITGHDTDVDLGLLGRLTRIRRGGAIHRWQHLYLWPLYGLLAIKWQLVDDFRKLISGGSETSPFLVLTAGSW